MARKRTHRGLGKHLVVPVLILGLALMYFSTVIAFAAGRPGSSSQATSAAPTQYGTATYVKWGLWEPRWQLSNGGVDFSTFTHAESAVNHHSDIVHWFAGWSESWAWYDSGLLQQVVKSGRTPMITWEPTGIALSDITAGKQDAYIDTWAKGIAATSASAPVIYLRIFHEFNDPMANGGGYAWGVNGGTTNTPADLVAAWRHVHDRFVAAHATNVKFVWSPDGTNFVPSLLAASYPGDAYVDYTGFDNYDYNTLQNYQVLTQITLKPMVLSEISSHDPLWISTLANQLNASKLPLVQAAIWFDDSEWAFDALPQVRTATTTMLAGTAFNPPVPCTRSA